MNLLFNVKIIVLEIKRPKIEQQLIMKKKQKTGWINGTKHGSAW